MRRRGRGHVRGALHRRHLRGGLCRPDRSRVPGDVQRGRRGFVHRECDIGACEAECTGNPGSFDCKAECTASAEADCRGECQASNNQGEASCKATISGQCDSSCEATPPTASCQAKCEARCEGECRGHANIDCQATCQNNSFVECEAELEVKCSGQCDGDGAIFCDNEYVDYGGRAEDCIKSLEAVITANVTGSASGHAMRAMAAPPRARPHARRAWSRGSACRCRRHAGRVWHRAPARRSSPSPELAHERALSARLVPRRRRKVPGLC